MLVVSDGGQAKEGGDKAGNPETLLMIEVEEMKLNDLPLRWQTFFEMKHPEGRACQQCGTRIPLDTCTFTRFPQDRFGMDRFCRDCMKAYQRASSQKKRARFRTTRHFVKGKTGPAMEGRRPLPCLEVGKKYRIGKECLGLVVAQNGPHWVVQTTTGSRCYTAGQLVGLEIRREA